MIFPTLPEKEFETEERCFIIEILNDPSHPNLSIARARVEPGETTVLHHLQGTHEYYYILEGEGQVELDRAYRRTVFKGDVVHIAPGMPQRITNTSDTDLIFLCICTPRFRQESYNTTEL